jgi:hypothetical protein
VVNVSRSDPVQLRPCRGFTQWLQRPLQRAGQQVAFLEGELDVFGSMQSRYVTVEVVK